VISASEDKTIRIWDFRTGSQIRTIPVRGRTLAAFAATPDGRRGITFSDGLSVWDLESGAEVRSLRGVGSDRIALSRDGRRAIVASLSEFKLWDLEAEDHSGLYSIDHGQVVSVAVTTDGRNVVSAHQEGAIKIWKLEGKEEPRVVSAFSSINSMALTHDGGRALVINDKSLFELDLIRLTEPRKVGDFQQYCDVLAVSPDGRRAATAHRGSICVWDLENGERLLSLPAHSDYIRALLFAPNGSLISGSWDGTIKVWSLERNTNLLTLQSGAVGVLSLSRDGGLLASGSASFPSAIRMWDTNSGEQKHVFPGQAAGNVSSLAMTPDGRRVIAAFGNKVIRLLDVSAGRFIADFFPEGRINSCAAAPDGTSFVLGDMLGRVHFLRLEGMDSI
jgi:WD40 repeat protein